MFCIKLPACSVQKRHSAPWWVLALVARKISLRLHANPFPPVEYVLFCFSSPFFICSCHHTARETGGSGLFNFLTFRQDWIGSSAKPDKKKHEESVSSWLSLDVAADSQRGGKKKRINAMHLFIQTVHLLCGESLASKITTTDTHTDWERWRGRKSLCVCERERERHEATLSGHLS